MKKLISKKTSALLVFMMIVSALSPILAFAASGFQSTTVNNGKVTGTVYVDSATYATYSVYGQKENRITINVYGANSDVATAVYATYSTYDAVTGKYLYTFESDEPVTRSTYYTLQYLDSSTEGGVVSQIVYDSYNPNNGGGFPGAFPPATGNGDLVGADGKVNHDQLIALLQVNENAQIKTALDTVYLPADALLNGKTLTIYNEEGVSITLPLSALKVADLAKSLGVELKDLVIRVEMKKLTGDAASAVSNAVKAIGGNQLSDAYDFRVVAEGAGKEVAIEKFGQFVSRTVPLTSAAGANATGVMFNPTTKALSFVPSTFATADNKTISTLKRDGMSIYTVVQGKSTAFTDTVNHWAKNDIATLSEKLIAEGTGNNLFSPNRNITRAEFAALIIRSLGVEPSTSTDTKFNDVKSSKWYAGSVAAAAEIGLVLGDGKGTFNPESLISRQEIAAIVVRASEFAGKSLKLTDAEVNAALVGYTDASSLQWAKAEVAAAVKAGIVQGQSATKLAGTSNATRAEAATMIARYLPISGLTN